MSIKVQLFPFSNCCMSPWILHWRTSRRLRSMRRWYLSTSAGTGEVFHTKMLQLVKMSKRKYFIQNNTCFNLMTGKFVLFFMILGSLWDLSNCTTKNRRAWGIIRVSVWWVGSQITQNRNPKSFCHSVTSLQFLGSQKNCTCHCFISHFGLPWTVGWPVCSDEQCLNRDKFPLEREKMWTHGRLMTDLKRLEHTKQSNLDHFSFSFLVRVKCDAHNLFSSLIVFQYLMKKHTRCSLWS